MIQISRKNKIKYIYIFVIMIAFSFLFGVCMLMLTVVPSDLSLISVLIADKRIIILNTLPIFLILLFIYFILNRVWISFLITGIFFTIIAEVNRFKITFRDDPFVFKDIFLLEEAKKMTERYTLFLDKASLCVIFILICITVLSAFFLKFKIDNKLFRIFGSVASITVLSILCQNIYFGNAELYESLWHYQFGNQWKGANQYMSRGVVYSFIHSIPDTFSVPPEGYDAKQAEMILENYDSQNIPENKKVNIISVMLEAYCDLSLYDGINFSVDPYENFHKLQSDSYYGNLYTNIFAAGTVATERSFLTGYNNPEMDAVDTESYVRYFKSQGYYTEAMHPCYGWFYDRRNVNEGLGFDNFDYYENAFSMISEEMLQRDMYSGFLSDYDFFNYIIQGFESAKEADRKYFNFSVTYQNHGPYPTEDNGGTKYVSWQDGYTTEEYNILNNYLSGIASTDEAIAHLYEYISQEEEPVILILFGDHKPWLGDNNSVYEMLGIDFDMSTSTGGENYYETPYLIYANNAAKAAIGKDFEEQGSTISPMFLMNELFGYMGIKGSQYLNYLADVKKEYDVINDIYVGKNGQYILKKETKDDIILREEEWVEYFVKNKR